jgi:hypothetical protein
MASTGVTMTPTNSRSLSTSKARASSLNARDAASLCACCRPRPSALAARRRLSSAADHVASRSFPDRAQRHHAR